MPILLQGAADEKNKVDKVLNFHYLICVLLPVLKKINKDHNIELEIEANVRGIFVVWLLLYAVVQGF